jgi:hypothetical protein
MDRCNVFRKIFAKKLEEKLTTLTQIPAILEERSPKVVIITLTPGCKMNAYVPTCIYVSNICPRKKGHQYRIFLAASGQCYDL